MVKYQKYCNIDSYLCNGRYNCLYKSIKKGNIHSYQNESCIYSVINRNM